MSMDCMLHDTGIEPRQACSELCQGGWGHGIVLSRPLIFLASPSLPTSFVPRLFVEESPSVVKLACPPPSFLLTLDSFHPHTCRAPCYFRRHICRGRPCYTARRTAFRSGYFAATFVLPSIRFACLPCGSFRASYSRVDVCCAQDGLKAWGWVRTQTINT